MEKWKTHLQKCSLFLGGLIVTLALFLPNTVGADDYFVSPNGQDTNAGTETQPFQTVNKGVGVLNPGDTLSIKSGTYQEWVDWDADLRAGTSWSKPITVKAFPGDTVTLLPNTGIQFVLRFIETEYIVIDGLILDGTNITNEAVKITWGTGHPAAHHIKIQNSEIRNAPKQGIVTSVGSDFNQFINLDVHHNGIEDNLTAGFSIKTSGNLIENCQIYDNSGGAIHVNGGAEGHRTKGNIFRGNRIRNNGREGITINRSDDNLIYNNMVWNNENGIVVGPIGNPKGTKVYNNTVYANQKYGIGVFAGAIDTEVLNNISHDISTNIFACRIMPLGDSITYDNNVCDAFAICPPDVSPRSPGQRTGYRKPLLELLEAAGFTHHVDFDFVGSEKGGGDLMVDPDNAGFPGITTAQLRELLEAGTYTRTLERDFVVGNKVKGPGDYWVDPKIGEWLFDHMVEVEDPTPTNPEGNKPDNGRYLETYPADIILLHIGTNGLDPNPQNVENLLMEIEEYERNHNKVMVILARIINRRCSMDQPPCNESSRTKDFNDNVEAMVRGRIDNGDRIIMVDMQDGAGIDYQSDMIDEWHPDESGYQKMAAVWLEALKKDNLLRNCNLGPALPLPTAPSNLRIN